MTPQKPDPLMVRYAEAGSPLPSSGVVRDSFWAGYQGQEGIRKGSPGSVQRRAYKAGAARAKAEPGLTIPEIAR